MNASHAAPTASGEDGQVPFEARKTMQDAIWRECIAPADNEWTTWTDSIVLAECAAKALVKAGWRVLYPKDFPGLCPSCSTLIEPGTRHGPFNGNQMFACEIIHLPVEQTGGDVAS